MLFDEGKKEENFSFEWHLMLLSESTFLLNYKVYKFKEIYVQFLDWKGNSDII